MYASIFLVAIFLSGTTAESEPVKCKDEVTNCEEVLDKMRCYEYGDQCREVMVWNMPLFLTFLFLICINCCFNLISSYLELWLVSRHDPTPLQ